MELEEYSSDTDDDDYIPSAAEESDDQQHIGSDVSNSDNEIKTEENDTDEKIETNLEETKRRKEALWSDFLKDTNITLKSTPKPNKAPVEKAESNGSSLQKKESKIFNFAGEVVKVKEAESVSTNLKAEPEPNAKLQSSLSSPSSSSIKKSGGLGSILGKISNKGTKLSTLDKSKLDWNEFKAEEGIEEELSFHNKGKNGYLERQAFLLRTDFRQFEIEKELRTVSHSKDKRR
uniref:Craniofacial development protein 1 n=1 Tax=Strigamia maritima TaxID=126957 RepID=T1JN00_STRMM